MVKDNPFSIEDRLIAITGAAGLLGREYARAIAQAGGTPLLLDIDGAALREIERQLERESGRCVVACIDVTDSSAVQDIANQTLAKHGPVWGLINNVAANPPMGPDADGRDRLENFPIEQWERDIQLGLTSAFECSRIFGHQMASVGAGSIVNIASDLAILAPDQRIYRNPEKADEATPVKPVSYSVVKAGLLGLTRYLATYWAPTPVRCNALLPGSVRGSQGPHLVANLEARIPLGRLATPDEYSGAVVFLLSDASAYMTGALLTMDGGRSVW